MFLLKFIAYNLFYLLVATVNVAIANNEVLKNDGLFNSTSVSQGYNSVEEFGSEQAQKNKQQEILTRSEIPANCKMVKYLQNGTMVNYLCGNKTIYTAVVVPRGGNDEASILEFTRKTIGCSNVISDSDIGKYVACHNDKQEVLRNFVRTNNSSIVLTAVVPLGVSDTDIAAMENFNLEIYFYQRGIAVNEERISYIKKMLSQTKVCVTSNCLW